MAKKTTKPTATAAVVRLTREDILAHGSKLTALRAIPLPELGTTLYALPLTARDGVELEETQKAALKDKAHGDHAAWLIARAIVYEDRTRVFTDEDVPQILDLPMAIFTPLMEAASEVNGLAPKAIAAAKNA